MFYTTFVDLIEDVFPEFVQQYEEFSHSNGFGGL